MQSIQIKERVGLGYHHPLESVIAAAGITPLSLLPLAPSLPSSVLLPAAVRLARLPLLPSVPVRPSVRLPGTLDNQPSG